MSDSPQRVTCVVLLFFAALIAYVDRGSLSIAMPDMAREFQFTPSQKGWMLGSFFMTYALLQIHAGLLIDRFNIRWIFAAGFAVWSVATLCTALARSMTALILMRLCLGAGESFMFPGFAKIVSANFPADARGLPNSILDAGTKIGPALGVFVGSLLAAGYGWRVMFAVLGTCSLLWLGPWLIWGPSRRVERPAAVVTNATSPSLRMILACRDAWGTFVGASCYTYAYFFLLTWLPSYLVDVRHLSLRELGTLGSAPYMASAAAAVASGWLSDRLIRAGRSVTRVRKTFVAVGLLLSTAAMPVAIVRDTGLALRLLVLAYVAFGIFASNLWTISQTLSGPDAAGKWAGLQNCFAALTGVAAPIITGYIIDRTGSYQFAFWLTAGLAVIGTLSYVFVVGEIVAIDWQRRDPEHS